MNFFKISIGIAAGLIIVTGTLLFGAWQNIQQLQEELTECRAELGALEEQAEAAREEEPDNGNLVSFRPLSDYEFRQFEQRGIEDPVSFLRDRLQEQPELIPEEGVLGGTMNFYDREAIHVLNDRWVLATYDDGHIMGEILLAYEIDEQHQVDWEVVAVSDE